MYKVLSNMIVHCFHYPVGFGYLIFCCHCVLKRKIKAHYNISKWLPFDGFFESLNASGSKTHLCTLLKNRYTMSL